MGTIHDAISFASINYFFLVIESSKHQHALQLMYVDAHVSVAATVHRGNFLKLVGGVLWFLLCPAWLVGRSLLGRVVADAVVKGFVLDVVAIKIFASSEEDDIVLQANG